MYDKSEQEKVDELIIFDKSEKDENHILSQHYHIDKMTLTYTSRYGYNYNARRYENNTAGVKAVLEVVFSDIVPFGTLLIDVTEKFTNYYTTWNLSDILGNLIPNTVRDRVADFSAEEKAMYLATLLGAPYFYPQNTFIEEDAKYFEYGVPQRFRYLQMKWGAVGLSYVFDARLRASSWEEITEQVSKAVSQAYGTYPLEYEYAYTNTDLHFRKVSIYRNEKGEWKNTNANNSRIKTLLSSDGQFRVPTHRKVGDMWHTEVGENMVELSRVIDVNNKCALIQVDRYSSVAHPTKICCTYTLTSSTLCILTEINGGEEEYAYKGKYSHFIEEPSDLPTPIDLKHFEEVEIIWENGKLTTNCEDQVKVCIEHETLVGIDTLVTMHLTNVHLNKDSDTMYVGCKGEDVFVLSPRDPRVQTGLKMLELAKKLGM